VTTIYQVIDDREGMNTVLATYDNDEAAEAHRAALAATDDVYGNYFLVESRQVSGIFQAETDFNGLEED
jgi:hypothetical protein